MALPISAGPELLPPTDEDRSAALLRWRRSHASRPDDPALAEAARHARIFRGTDGPEFDPDSFAELFKFIEELPF
jgi:hypothetical protein